MSSSYYITRLSSKAISLAQKPFIQRVYRFSLLQSIEIGEMAQKKSLQLYDMFPFKHSVEDLKQGARYILNFDYAYAVNSTLKDAIVFTIVIIELLFWFFVGEIIGKRKVFGYRHIGYPLKSGH